MSNFWSSVIAADYLVLQPEILHFVSMPITIAANMRQINYVGILMFQYSEEFLNGKVSENQTNRTL